MSDRAASNGPAKVRVDRTSVRVPCLRLVGFRPWSSPRWRLALALGMIAILWLVVLPWLADRPRVRARLEWLDSRRIDPSARYYTDLEAMKPILQRLEGRPPVSRPVGPTPLER
jgi:hypothetical protein